MLDITSSKEKLKQSKTEEEINLYWKEILAELDKEEHNNDRMHTRSDRRANFNLSVLETGTDEYTTYIPSEITRLYQEESFENIIFSKKYEDLWQLPRYAPYSIAIKLLTEKQQEVLFLKGVWGYTETEIAEYKGVSQSSVSQLYKTAIENINKYLKKN